MEPRSSGALDRGAQRGAAAGRVRHGVRVTGVVQGVGFRPFVWRLAEELQLDGWVRNDAAGVEIEVEGPRDAVERFCRRLETDAPSLARVEQVVARDLGAAVPGSPGPARPAGFSITASVRGARATTAVSPDVALCDECREELLSPADRRYRYPFINCTQCGPRFTITARLPYDRPNTSMAPFPLCPTCRAEYESPASRRFHAEPNACPVCGPRLWIADAAGRALPAQDAIAEAARRIGRGEIVAIKGLGGFHLACDARCAAAIERLRGRKLREAKPLAVMFANAGSAAALAVVGPAEAALLLSAERPIVLCDKGPTVDEELPGVAPGMAALGAMLPYTPIHYLLFHEAAGRPQSAAWADPRTGAPQPLALIMTSANPGGEPLVTGNDEAIARLEGIADAFLLADRDILLRCDDSVARVDDADGSAGPQLLRRARGYAPRGLRLPAAGPSVLALGASLKNTVCLTRGAEAFLSPHVGDLDNAPTCAALVEAAAHLERILEAAPALVAHDLHPDFFSTRFAASLAAERGLPTLGVQHHHAHIAAVLCEHGERGPALGLALDGVGLGKGGGAWGGELLRVDGPACRRLGHLRELALPGGDRAAREPWRMAASALHALGRGDEIAARFPGQRAAPLLAAVLDRGVHCPPTSSAGRLFDAAAALLGLREEAQFEGQAAMELEALAGRHGPVQPLEGGILLDGAGAGNAVDGGNPAAGFDLDPRPLLAHLAAERDAARGAACFHATLAAALADWALAAAAREGLGVVALGGGCFLNRLLTRAVRARLSAAGLRVLTAHAVPPNDGGLALGQAWVALMSTLRS